MISRFILRNHFKSDRFRPRSSNFYQKGDSADLRRRRAVFLEETGTRKSVQTVLVSPEGVVRNKYAASVQAVVTLADLFA